jgi:hypothetical protein
MSQQEPVNSAETQVCPAEAALLSVQEKQITESAGVELLHEKVLVPGLAPLWAEREEPEGKELEMREMVFPASGSLH